MSTSEMKKLEVRIQELEGLLKKSLDALESAQGNIKPERGFADEVEAEINDAIDAIRPIVSTQSVTAGNRPRHS